jgi:hypothetical protein
MSSKVKFDEKPELNEKVGKSAKIEGRELKMEEICSKHNNKRSYR